MNLYDGADYVPERDDWRLTAQLRRIFVLMRDRQWRTLQQIAKATGDPEPSISARLRDFRKTRHGGHTTEKRYLHEGLYEYQLVLNDADTRRRRPEERPNTMRRRLLCVDMSYQVYRASAAFPMLTSRRVFTGGLYGFLIAFAKAIRETRATDAAFCMDAKPYLRSLVYPEYKQLRKKKADDELLKMYQASMVLVLDLLEAIGVATWSVPGFESDDLIAHCGTKYRHRFEAIYAQSNDSDLYQLFGVPNFHVYRDSIAKLMNGATLLANTGFTPAQFMLASAIQGTHNDIAGIPNVGPVTARRAVTDAAVMRAMREKGAAIIDRNLGLIKLPHPEFPYAECIPAKADRFDARAFHRFLNRYDVDVTASMENAFHQLQGD